MMRLTATRDVGTGAIANVRLHSTGGEALVYTDTNRREEKQGADRVHSKTRQFVSHSQWAQWYDAYEGLYTSCRNSQARVLRSPVHILEQERPFRFVDHSPKRHTAKILVH